MLDFLLPKMSGWEVFQKIQANPELRKIPLVIMSGRKEEVTEKIQEPFEYFEFLGKPFDQKQLIGAIKSAMTKAKKPRPEPALAAAITTNNGNVATTNTSNRTIATPNTNNGTVATLSSSNAKVVTSNEATDSAAEIQALNEKIIKMQADIDGLKKQLTQVVAFIKQKINWCICFLFRITTEKSIFAFKRVILSGGFGKTP